MGEGKEYFVVNVEPREGVARCECDNPSTLGPMDRMGTLAGGGVITESFCFQCHVWLHLVDGVPVATKLVPEAALRYLARELGMVETALNAIEEGKT